MTRPSSTLELQEEERAFYAALGKALTQWQRVEENLAIIYSTIVGSGGIPDMAANASFHSVLNFNIKLDMADSALRMKAYLASFDRKAGETDPMIEAWNPLRARAEKRAKRRNALAHFGVSVDVRRKPGYRYSLQPSTIDMRAWMLNAGNPPRLHVCNLIAQGNSFESLGYDLSLFYLRFLFPRGELGPLAAYPEQ